MSEWDSLLPANCLDLKKKKIGCTYISIFSDYYYSYSGRIWGYTFLWFAFVHWFFLALLSTYGEQILKILLVRIRDYTCTKKAVGNANLSLSSWKRLAAHGEKELLTQ